MLRIHDRPLPTSIAAKLREYQNAVDEFPTFAGRVEEAKRKFSATNKSTNPVFKVVRQTLDEMCRGARRCMYCEDSVADEIEHFKPKDFYPSQAFAWGNYLYACGPCNVGKNNKFPLISERSGLIIYLRRRPGEEPFEPDPGDAVLPDPRKDDPLEYLQLDLIDTFYFQPLDPNSLSIRHLRAGETSETLCLNSRDYLCRARAEAFHAYSARLDQYIQWRKAGVAQETLERLRDSLRRMGHPTVWAEMKRQRHRLPQLRRLFEEAPEALEW